MAIFTSNASIFLPRYSGVRPTIRPAMNTAEHDEDHDSVQPRADSAEDYFAQHDIDQRNHSAERRERIVPSIDGAATRIRGHRGEQRRVGNAEADFLALHVSAGLHVLACCATVDGYSGFPCASAQYATVTPARNRIAIAHQTAHPCAGEPVIRPSV